MRSCQARWPDSSREPMTESEMVHFNSDAVSLEELFAKLEPIVKAYACDQTRKPVDVSFRLNAEGYTAAAGAPWTPRLVHFLLALMFNDPKPDKKPETRSARPAPCWQSAVLNVRYDWLLLTGEWALIRRRSKLAMI
jgi:hypothetical protein